MAAAFAVDERHMHAISGTASKTINKHLATANAEEEQVSSGIPNYCSSGRPKQISLNILGSKMSFVANNLSPLLSKTDPQLPIALILDMQAWKQQNCIINPLLPNVKYRYRAIKISFIKKGPRKKFPRSAASMSR